MMQSSEFDISELTLLEDNPRCIGTRNFNKLKRDMLKDRDFLFQRPVLVNRVGGVNVVYAGNHRVLAGQSLGWKTIPCIIEDNLDDVVMRERVLRDNVQYARFDFDKLANEWQDEIVEFDLPEINMNRFENFDKFMNNVTICKECGTEITNDDERK